MRGTKAERWKFDLRIVTASILLTSPSPSPTDGLVYLVLSQGFSAGSTEPLPPSLLQLTRVRVLRGILWRGAHFIHSCGGIDFWLRMFQILKFGGFVISRSKENTGL